MHPLLYKYLAPVVAEISGQQLLPEGTLEVVETDQTNKGLKQSLQAQQRTNADLYARLLTQVSMTQQLAQLLSTVVGGEEVAASLQQLYALLQANVASDNTTAADLLQRIQAALQLSTDNAVAVQLARQIADNAQSLVQAQATTLADHGQKLATTTTELAKKASITAVAEVAGAAATALDEANKRLLRAGDMATGPIMVPKATQDAAAPRLEQTYGGLNAPIRFATAVGNTNVPMLPGPLTDPTPQGRKAKPYLVQLTMRTTPGLAATITVGTTPGGSQVFSKTFVLTALPVLNNLLAPMQPVFVELPAGTTLYAKATSGTWDIEVFSYYKT